MRADRLLSLLMLLQARGRMTAPALAQELEVSERTIYRDITALSAAGVPVYSETGCMGGFALVDRYRTNLTGLTDGELRALFMMSIPAPLVDLGLGAELRAALLKLAAALPDSRRGDEARIRQRFHLDSTWWGQRKEYAPHLHTIHIALWQDCRLEIAYRLPFASRIERLVDPYGLVAKAGVWHLVYAMARRVRVMRVSDLLDARLTAQSFERPSEFDLAVFWEKWCAEYESLLVDFKATVRVAPEFVSVLPRYFGEQVGEPIAGDNIATESSDEAGWLHIELSFKSFEAARELILGFGRGVEVLEPRALRQSIIDYAEQIIDLYAGS